MTRTAADALDGLNQLLRNRRMLQAVRQQIAENPHVRERGLRIDHLTLRRFFELVRTGVSYAATTYGPAALPGKLRISSWSVNEAGENEIKVIGYDPTDDCILLTHVFVADRCSRLSDGLFYEDYNLPGQSVRADDRTVLQAVEECYHRVQILNGDFALDRSSLPGDSIELAVQPVWLRAVADLRIQTRPARV